MRDNRGNAKRYYERHKNEDVYKACKREYARKHYLKRKATLQRKTENG